MMENIEIINKFGTISLEELERLKFINRFDNKYIFSQELLETIFPQMISHYKILEINGIKIFHYNNDYYDTSDFQFYLAHHNDRKNRFKVRVRNYSETDQTYLEIKLKNNKSLTNKIRLKIQNGDTFQIKKYDKFFLDNINLPPNTLEHKIKISYNRLTFLSNSNNEKVTFDYNLNFVKGNTQSKLSNLVIAEIKTSKRDNNSIIEKEFSKNGIRSIGFSKYEIGCIKLYKNLKYNRFKENLLKINKIG